MPDDRTTPPEEEAPSSLAEEDTLPVLVVVWSADEPDRVGEIAFVSEERATFGRSDDGARGRLRFVRQRPDGVEPRPPIASQGISREQLAITRTPQGLEVVRRGLPELLVNGAAVESARVKPGDVIEVKQRMLLLYGERPRRLPALRHVGVEMTFGAPDAHGILGESPAAWKLRDDLGYAREAIGHVLITGESGTGKELAARALHATSSRSGKPLVAHNAATFPAGLIDSELFGNPRNYPNPGTPERPGLIGEADGGVLFLDEIGELPPELHARLLRVLDAGGEYTRLGEAGRRTSDFRLVAATNREPSVLKHDLLSRLSVRVALPSLRERREDVPLLVRALVLESYPSDATSPPAVAGRHDFA